MIVLSDEGIDKIKEVLNVTFQYVSQQIPTIVIPTVEQLIKQNSLKDISIDPSSRRVIISLHVDEVVQIDFDDTRGFQHNIELSKFGEISHFINGEEISSLSLDKYCEEDLEYYITVEISTPVYVKIMYYSNGNYTLEFRV